MVSLVPLQICITGFLDILLLVSAVMIYQGIVIGVLSMRLMQLSNILCLFYLCFRWYPDFSSIRYC